MAWRSSTNINWYNFAICSSPINAHYRLNTYLLCSGYVLYNTNISWLCLLSPKTTSSTVTIWVFSFLQVKLILICLQNQVFLLLGLSINRLFVYSFSNNRTPVRNLTRRKYNFISSNNWLVIVSLQSKMCPEKTAKIIKTIKYFLFRHENGLHSITLYKVQRMKIIYLILPKNIHHWW